MNLINILYEPYVIIIFSSLFITLITYFIIVNQKNKEKNKNNKPDPSKTNISKTLLYTFIISFIILTVLKFTISYLNTKNFFVQKAGVINTVDNLTIIADDVDFDLIDD